MVYFTPSFSFLRLKDARLLKYMAIHSMVVCLANLKVTGFQPADAETHEYIAAHPFSGMDGGAGPRWDFIHCETQDMEDHPLCLSSYCSKELFPINMKVSTKNKEVLFQRVHLRHF